MSTKKTIATIIGVLLMFGCQFLPPVFGLTPLGMQVAGIFIGTILLWMFVSVTWPSILCIIALILSPLYTYSSGLSGSMGGWITSFVLFSSMVTYTLGQTELKYEKGDRFPQIVVLGILFFASLSTAATPIAHTVTTMALSLYENDAGVPVNFVSYTIFGVAACLVTFAASMVLTKFVCRPGTERLSSLDSSVLKSETTPMSRQEKYTLLVFVLVVAMWLLPGIIAPVLPEVASAISSLGTPTPAMIGACLLCVLHVEGKPLMNFNEAVAKGVPWGAVFMVAATSVLGSALTHEEAGITAVVSGALSPIIGSMSPIIFVLFIALATVMITNFASNTVTVTLMYSISLPLVYGGAIPGVDPAALTCVIGACACVACATPPSTAHAAIAAGSGWLNTDTMLKYGLLWSVTAAVIFAVVGYPIAAAIM